MIQGRIYKIINSVDDSLYIGSTTLDLKLRFYLHKNHSKICKHRLLYKKINELGIENFKIELIEEVKCDSKQDLKTIEGTYIKQFGNLNNNMAGRTIKEWRQLKDLCQCGKHFTLPNRNKHKLCLINNVSNNI